MKFGKGDLMMLRSGEKRVLSGTTSSVHYVALLRNFTSIIYLSLQIILSGAGTLIMEKLYVCSATRRYTSELFLIGSQSESKWKALSLRS